MKKNFKISLAIVIVFTMAITIMSVFGLHNVVSAADDSVHIIDSCGVVIRESGTYVLAGDIICRGNETGWNKMTAIKILADDVIIDGRGYTISGTSNLPSGSTGIMLQKVSKVKIRNLNVKNFCVGVSLVGSNNNTLDGIKTSNFFVEINLSRSHNNKIANNIMNGHSGRIGLYVVLSDNNYISKNIIKGFLGVGLEINHSKRNRILNNHVVVDAYGMSFSYSNMNIIQNNFVKVLRSANIFTMEFLASKKNFGDGNCLIPQQSSLCINCLSGNNVYSYCSIKK